MMRKEQIKITILFSIGYFFYYLARYNYPIALPFIKAEYGVTSAQIGSIASALTLAYAFGQLFNGFIVDRVGGRLMFSLGGILASLFNFLMGSNTIFGLFILIWALNGYSQSMGYPSTLKFISNWFPDRNTRGKVLGVSEALQSFGSIVIPIAAGIFAMTLGWRYIFFIPSVALFASSIVCFLLMKDSPVKAVERKPFWQDMKESYKTAFSNSRLISANFSYGFSQFVRYAMITWIPVYLYTLSGHSIYQAALFGAVFQIGGLIGSPIIGWLSDTTFLNRKWLLIFLGMVMSGITGAAIGFVPYANPWLIVALLLLCGAAIESLEVAYFLTPVEILGDELSATGVGTMNATGKFIASLQGVFLGWMIDAFGYYAAFATAGMFGIVSAVLVLPLRKVRRNV